METSVTANDTLETLPSDSLKHAWASYFIFIMLSSLIGDSIILIASVRYRAFKLHRLIVGVIQHLAACDIMVSICLIPQVVALIADSLVLSEWVCDLSAYSLYYLVTSSFFLITMMTASKLYIVKFPMRAKVLRSRRAHVGCAIIWAFAMVVPVTMIITDGFVISTFDSETYSCTIDLTNRKKGTWIWLEPLSSAVFVLFPNGAVLVCTALLLREAITMTRRSSLRTSLKWQGIITTIVVAIVYCISTFPYCIYRLLAARVPESPGSIFHHEFMRFAKSIIFLNTTSNFYIYCLTVSSFREFLLVKLNLSRQPSTITPRKG